MCQSSEQGGKRCDCDSSGKRRLRRKVFSSLPGQSSIQRFHDLDETDIIPRDELKDEAVSLSSRIHSSPPSLETDAEHEEDMTRFGASILHHAQNLPDQTTPEDKRLIKGYKQEIEELSDKLKKPLPPPAKKDLRRKMEVAEEKLALTEQKEESRKILVLLNEARDFGGEVEFDSDSNPEMSQYYQDEVSKHYPSAWIASSNSHDQKVNLVSYKLNELGGMAGAYFHNAVSDEKTGTVTSVDRSQVQNLSGDSESIRNIRDYIDQKGSMISTHSLTKNDGKETGLAVFKVRKFKPLSSSVDEDEWEKASGVESIVANYDKVQGKNLTPSQLNDFAQANPVWVTREDKTRYKVNGNLVVASDLPAVEKRAVAIHEFGHRMENVVPNNALPRMEQAFLRRRSGLKPEDEVVYKDVKAGGGYSEDIGVCYNTDITTTEYASKTYLNGRSEEVFTVGIENVFGIKKSGDRKNPDKDYKSFVVGCLASI